MWAYQIKRVNKTLKKKEKKLLYQNHEHIFDT